jgi:RNA polymerase subunit RPABC4/transcription elongation factor Spt4
MFFIGIFGVDQKQKQIGTYNNAICPNCGTLTRFEVYKSYSYFHVFFIPTFRWNVKYYVKPACCGSIYELNPVIGQEYEKGFNPEIRNEDIQPLNLLPPFKTCSGCGARVEPGFTFCPYCGRML